MKTLLVVSQTFIPDPASVGQHVADVALTLAERGYLSGKYNVRVYASARGFENPDISYPRREMLGHADVRRFPFASFGKKSMRLRVFGTAGFMVQAFFAALTTPRLAGIFFSTSPPLIGWCLTIAAAIRRVPTVYWAMDLNPDQLIALGKIQRGSFIERVLERVNRGILRRSTMIVALDRFMADRLVERGISRSKIVIMPPWPHEDKIHDEGAAASENPFRAKHDLAGKFLIMYSGNHSPSNPLTTLLEAVVQLRDESNLHFMFIGGGAGKREVEEYISKYKLTNAVSLPYQPISDLKYSLTAADVHVVSLGEKMVGIIHPCKIYGAMAAGRPILFLGPKPSHISDLLDKHSIGIQISHGDVEGMLEAIRRFVGMPQEEMRMMGGTAATVLEESLSQAKLCNAFCDNVERAMGLAGEEFLPRLD